jgi:hypothetical protein
MYRVKGKTNDLFSESGRTSTPAPQPPPPHKFAFFEKNHSADLTTRSKTSFLQSPIFTFMLNNLPWISVPKTRSHVFLVRFAKRSNVSMFARGDTFWWVGSFVLVFVFGFLCKDRIWWRKRFLLKTHTQRIQFSRTNILYTITCYIIHIFVKNKGADFRTDIISSLKRKLYHNRKQIFIIVVLIIYSSLMFKPKKCKIQSPDNDSKSPVFWIPSANKSSTTNYCTCTQTLEDFEALLNSLW